MEPYRTVDELHYFASDINKFIQKECRKDMTVTNIDCLIHNHEKDGIHYQRIIEFKHRHEKLGTAQIDALRELSRSFICSNEHLTDLRIESFVIWGDYPFDDVEIYNIITKETKYLHNPEKFKKFLNWEITFNEL